MQDVRTWMDLSRTKEQDECPWALQKARRLGVC